MQVKIKNDEVQFCSKNSKCSITFQRTLRIPDDNKIYPLPPSLGPFPIKKVDDYKNKVPKEWIKHGGIFIPMYQREAMWMKFNGNHNTPMACKVAIGKINAISGKSWNQKLKKGENDYVVIPNQPWLDGINSGNGHIKQFVAMPLGQGYTVEGQITGKEEFGGIQLIAYDSKKKEKNVKILRSKPKNPPKFPNYPSPNYPPSQPTNPFQPNQPPLMPFFAAQDDCFIANVPPVSKQMKAPLKVSQFSKESYSVPNVARKAKKSVRMNRVFNDSLSSRMNNIQLKEEREGYNTSSKAREMGLSAGGRMKQKIYKDPYGIKNWDENQFGRVYVHIINSEMYKEITGELPPPTPITAKLYTEYGYPWYDIYDEDSKGVDQSKILQGVKSIKEMDEKKYAWPQQNDQTVTISGNQVKTYKKDKNEIRDGDW